MRRSVFSSTPPVYRDAFAPCPSTELGWIAIIARPSSNRSTVPRDAPTVTSASSHGPSRGYAGPIAMHRRVHREEPCPIARVADGASPFTRRCIGMHPAVRRPSPDGASACTRRCVALHPTVHRHAPDGGPIVEGASGDYRVARSLLATQEKTKPAHAEAHAGSFTSSRSGERDAACSLAEAETEVDRLERRAGLSGRALRVARTNA